MRQDFDIGDLVTVTIEGSSTLALVLEKKIINSNYDGERRFHIDEYSCKVRFISPKTEDVMWIRAKWLKHISKVN